MDIWNEPIAYKKGAAYLGAGFTIKPLYDDYIGVLRAIDPATGKIRLIPGSRIWELALAFLPRPNPHTNSNSEPIVQRGDLLFRCRPRGLFKRLSRPPPHCSPQTRAAPIFSMSLQVCVLKPQASASTGAQASASAETTASASTRVPRQARCRFACINCASTGTQTTASLSRSACPSRSLSVPLREGQGPEPRQGPAREPRQVPGRRGAF